MQKDQRVKAVAVPRLNAGTPLVKIGDVGSVVWSNEKAVGVQFDGKSDYFITCYPNEIETV